MYLGIVFFSLRLCYRYGLVILYISTLASVFNHCYLTIVIFGQTCTGFILSGKIAIYFAEATFLRKITFVWKRTYFFAFNYRWTLLNMLKTSSRLDRCLSKWFLSITIIILENRSMWVFQMSISLRVKVSRNTAKQNWYYFKLIEGICSSRKRDFFKPSLSTICQ